MHRQVCGSSSACLFSMQSPLRSFGYMFVATTSKNQVSGGPPTSSPLYAQLTIIRLPLSGARVGPCYAVRRHYRGMVAPAAACHLHFSRVIRFGCEVDDGGVGGRKSCGGRLLSCPLLCSPPASSSWRHQVAVLEPVLDELIADVSCRQQVMFH